MRSLLAPTALATLPEVRIAGEPLSSSSARWVRFELLLALDRPDRLELALESGGPGALADDLRPGVALTARLDGQDVFTGIADRVAVEASVARGRCRTLVAYAAYEGRRLARSRDRYLRQTDSEIAAQIAGELGLAARIESTVEVHAELERDGDPLLFLRNRARALGFQLGVTAGRLHFARALPDAGEVRLPERGLIASRLLERRLGNRVARGGFVDTPGDARLRPLVCLRLEEGDEARYRIVRVLHRLDREGYRTRLELLDAEADLASWREAPGLTEDG